MCHFNSTLFYLIYKTFIFFSILKADSSTSSYTDKYDINLYQIINFFLNLIIKNQREDYSLDATILCMIINILKLMLLEAEPTQVDAIVKSIISELKHKYDYLRLIDENDFDEDDELKFTKELTLEMLFNWIDESIENSQIGLVTLYVNIISNLNSNPEWRPKVLNFIDKIFTLILASLNSDPSYSKASKYSQSKLFNFMYALNCTPYSTSKLWKVFLLFC